MRLALLAIVLLGVLGGSPATAAAVPVPAPAADLGVSVTDDADPVSGGNDVTYTIVVANSGPDAADATLADAVPSGTTFKSLDVPPGWSCTTPAPGDTGSISCSSASIAAGGSATFRLTVHVSSGIADGSVLSDVATVDTTATDSNQGNDSATETTTIENDADVAIAKSASADSVPPGGTIDYTIEVTNNGPADAANVAWSDTLPPETTFVTASQGGGPAFTCTAPAIGSAGSVDCSIGSLPAGSTASFTVTVMTSGHPSSAAVTNTATVTSDTADFSEDSNNSSTTTTYVRSTADLSVTKSDSPDPVDAGGSISYTIDVKNNGASPVGNVVLTEEVPDGTTFDSISGGPQECSTPDAGGGGTIECGIPSLAAGDTVTYTLTVTVLPSQDNGSTIGNTASVSSSTNTDLNSGNDSATATTTVQASADLHARNTDSPDPVLAGNDLTYTIDVDNNGPADAHGVSLADTLPSGTTFVSLDAPAGFSCTTPAVGAAGAVNCGGGTVDLAGASFTLVVKVDSSVASSTMLSDAATFSSTTPDANPGDESATATTTVGTQADLAISKSGTPGSVAPGGQVTYTIEVDNKGPSDAASVSMDDPLPAGTSFKSIDAPAGFTCTTGALVTCTAANVAAGAKPAFTLVVQVDQNAPPGAISNTASVSSSTSDPDGTNQSATENSLVEPTADLAMTASGSPDPVTAGTDLTYTLGVENDGPRDASNVSLSDDLPSGTTFKSITGPAGFSCTTPAVGSGGNVKCTASSLANGASASFTLVVHVAADRAAGSTLSNTASVSRDEVDTNSANDSATAATPVTTSADLSTSVSDAADPVTAGDVATYHMHIENGGPSDASQPRLTVPIPAGTTLVGAAQTDGSAFNCTSDGTTVTCAATSLASGDGAAIDMAVKTPQTLSGTITASPNASSSTSDPDRSNDDSSETTAITPVPTSVTIRRVTKELPSGDIVVVVGCFGTPGQKCPVTVVVTFKKPLLPRSITATKTIKAGREASNVFVVGPRRERRRIKRSRSLPVHVSVANRTGSGAAIDTTISGP